MKVSELTPGMVYMKVEKYFPDSLIVYLSSFQSKLDGRCFYTFYNKEISTTTYYNSDDIELRIWSLKEYIENMK